MKYLKICDHDARNEEMSDVLVRVAKACARFAAMTGAVKYTWPHHSRYYRGQSRVHYEADAIYMRIDDFELANFLKECHEFDGRFRAAHCVHIIEPL